MYIPFVSIDSSLANTGIASGKINFVTGEVIVNKISLVETTKSKNKQIRANSDSIGRTRETYNFVKNEIELVKPRMIFAETPSGSQSAAGMKSYGATCQLIGSLTPQPIEVTPEEVKMASVGKKTASKEDMMNWASKLHPDVEWIRNKSTGELQNKNEHMADAIAIVYAGIQTKEYKQLISLLN
jgi:Holliday junction resolvasome RuvABC endonuclease subunit